jgi:uncharacterized membrane protein YoaK (UPF0700 family)
MPTGAPDKNLSRSSRKEKPFQVSVGSDFGTIEDVDAKTRGFIARAVVLAAIVGVVAAGLYGLFTGNFMAVASVWAVAGPLIGAVVAYYFGPQRNDTG